ncbi:bifunctional D-glycero-beta-D-manno-heptose-7-phosphate kinase/D-glycero-beta-D-manno-heptose 1-phosphate adenylyltransferase HldE [Rheinheimera sp.]|uniref:bifunctional D-glycero-beta-D-manno-heptose-7-phosphate kinase/D-glycero-beta-D-manno-heptose 1-phosphate adenylyltransferase HldE n=1 Tax=Rheinheimera sp. TaxID=1869214 RepID=UPI00307E3B64
MINLALLQQLSKASVLVVGDVMLDRYFNGDSQRISPEAPVPVVKISKIEDKAGGAANVARNIAHLDGKVGLLGIIGQDSAGDSLLQLLESEHIESQLVRQHSRPTIAKMRVVSRQQQIVRLDQEESFSADDATALAEKFAAVLPLYDVVVFSDYAKGSLQQVQAMIRQAKAAGKIVLVDPKQADLTVYAGADIITPNLAEFRLAGGQTGSEQQMLESARAFMQKAELGAILLTRSEQGMSLITASDHHHFPAQVLEVSDVTGAGDTVIATLAVMLSAGFSLPEATELSNLAAGIVVGKVGAATVSPEELAQKLNKHLFRQGEHYQTPYDKVLQHIEFAKKAGERIVFTNGCFDILHAGHVRYLAQAKALGDRLVVGLNTDASVARLKGPQRPINSLEDRATVLSSLASVDWVVPFGDNAAENDTPLHLIQQVNPDVLVKGGDYSIDTIVGADFVLQNGGEVQVLTFVDGRSTSKVIRKIQDLS